MDYKYIHQLLERYWKCETTIEEEQILRTFFSQGEVPVELLPYRSLFVYEKEQHDLQLGVDFDERVMAEINKTTVKARKVSFASSMKPFYKAVAVVAVFLTLGIAAEKAIYKNNAENDYSSVVDKAGYARQSHIVNEEPSSLMMVSEGLNKTIDGDSVTSVNVEKNGVKE